MTEDNNQNTGGKLEERVTKIVQCSWCPKDQQRVKISDRFWTTPEFLPLRIFEQYEHAKKNTGISHGMCPYCEKESFSECGDPVTYLPGHQEGYKDR